MENTFFKREIIHAFEKATCEKNAAVEARLAAHGIPEDQYHIYAPANTDDADRLWVNRAFCGGTYTESNVSRILSERFPAGFANAITSHLSDLYEHEQYQIERGIPVMGPG